VQLKSPSKASASSGRFAFCGAVVGTPWDVTAVGAARATTALARSRFGSNVTPRTQRADRFERTGILRIEYLRPSFAHPQRR